MYILKEYLYRVNRPVVFGVSTPRIMCMCIMCVYYGQLAQSVEHSPCIRKIIGSRLDLGHCQLNIMSKV